MELDAAAGGGGGDGGMAGTEYRFHRSSQKAIKQRVDMTDDTVECSKETNVLIHKPVAKHTHTRVCETAVARTRIRPLLRCTFLQLGFIQRVKARVGHAAHNWSYCPATHSSLPWRVGFMW